ncbi:hypothetical protein LTR36_001005 [Oleoguttula mirabilis]|uniref:FAM192A/Fyv6 N-terminal domain-containing protein n=1 Tax=Oleoguttula mirabilis TaxID=1507867 RepID=A0AAV9JQ78_9PEZI|nr:hypothetical protein LTR36_001005 [Oleoguttula mirabilis]
MSRFVSAGGADEPTAQDEAWLEAQRKIEATRQKKPEVGQQEDGKSLFDTLQANKAAKQDAFEEATRLRNQFRSLDEDEVDFLDSVLESTRSKEASVKKETMEQLAAFRTQREEAEKAATQEEVAGSVAATETWAVGPRKRKKGRETEGIGGVKIRRTSTAEAKGDTAGQKSIAAQDVGRQLREPPEAGKKAGPVKDNAMAPKKAASPAATAEAPPAPVPALGLAAYSSDEED